MNDKDSGPTQPTETPGLTRRWAMTATLTAVATASFGAGFTQALSKGLEPLKLDRSRALSFFNAAERVFVVAATSRLIPTDETGPGAAEADVCSFIDRQLSGPYGHGDGWYLAGPFADGKAEQGWQSSLTPAQLYRMFIPAIDAHCTRSFSGLTFEKLTQEQQDTVLRDMQKGDIRVAGFSARIFFQLLHQNTIEAFFSDPVYGGNRNFTGWTMISYPGVRYDWRPWIGRHGERVDWPIVGLHGTAQNYSLPQP